jgi:hypothetical protein
MEVSLDRLRYFTVGLIKDAIAWTPAPFDHTMKTTLVDCLRIAQSDTFEEDDFMRVRHMLNEGGMYTVPPLPDEDDPELDPEIAGVLFPDLLPPVKKYRIINLATNAEWEADTSEEVWEILGKRLPLFGLYEVRDNITNEIVPEFIPL